MNGKVNANIDLQASLPVFLFRIHYSISNGIESLETFKYRTLWKYLT